MGIEYAREKMDQLISILATGVDPLPDRLEGVHLPLSGAIHDAKHLGYPPADVLERLQGVKARLTSVKGGDEGHVVATLKVMTPDEARDIAQELVDLSFPRA
jgi:hypothetical protein